MIRVDVAHSKKNIETLLTDDSFIRWIEGKADPVENAKWQEWAGNDPARGKLVKEAKSIHELFRLSPPVSPLKEKELARLNRRIDKYETTEKKGPLDLVVFSRTKRNRRWIPAVSIAAVFLITVLASVFFLYQVPEQSVEPVSVFEITETEYGQKKVLTLADGSSIMLQANSNLKYQAKDSAGTVEFWLQGEAYFDIKPQTGSGLRTYRVYTEDGQAEVIGTKFNVNTFKTGTEVVLEEGKLRVMVADSQNFGGAERIMEPGEWNRFVYSGETIDVKPVNVELYTSWTHNKLIFDRTPLQEIAERIRHIYGVDFTITSPDLQQIEISGSVPNDNLPVLLNALESMLERPIVNNNGVIRL